MKELIVQKGGYEKKWYWWVLLANLQKSTNFLMISKKCPNPRLYPKIVNKTTDEAKMHIVLSTCMHNLTLTYDFVISKISFYPFSKTQNRRWYIAICSFISSRLRI